MENVETLKNEIITAIKDHITQEILSSEERTERRFEARFIAIDAQFDAINQELRSHNMRFDEIDDQLQVLGEGQDIIHGRIDRLQQVVFSMGEKVDQIDERLIRVERNQQRGVSVGAR